jgi:hypothetical protein
MSKTVMISYIVMSVGTVIWVYGYFTTGSPPIFDWKAYTPSWIAEFLPNLESEIGMALVCASMVPMYWRSRR